MLQARTVCLPRVYPYKVIFFTCILWGETLKSFYFVWAGLLSIAGLLGFLAEQRHVNDLTSARAHYIAANHSETERYTAQLNDVLRTIREDLSILAKLPSVRNVDRHGHNMSEEAKITFQQIYNNLADHVAISEVYVLPIDFKPERLDPETLRNEEPIVAYDQLIVDAGNGMTRVQRQTHPTDVNGQPSSGIPEVEDFEYQQMVEQLTWFKTNYPQLTEASALDMPIISGSEVITCDNTDFITSHADKDRSGIVFSVPFYDQQGQIKGMVSGIIRSNALKGLLPAPQLALVNPENNYAVMGADVATFTGSLPFVTAAKTAPGLAYSETTQIGGSDTRHPWYVWAGKPEQDFLASKDLASANQEFRNALLAIAASFAAACGFIWLVRRNLRSAYELSASLANQRDMAERSDRESREAASKLQELHDDVTALNGQLSDKLHQLAEAQDEIVRKGRLSQLGQLVATVAHELRNPLGSVRTSCFVLRRRLGETAMQFEAQLARMESGITRCDSIISQLLDFSRTQAPVRETTDLCEWLQTVLNEEAPRLNSQISIQAILPEGILISDIDKERMRRCIINLVSNAAEAMTAQGKAADNPTITIELRTSERGTEIVVSDNGPGIPPEMMAKIGEPLFTTKSFGTGLGLAATRKVAELHGGGIDVASQPGEGAKFTVWFPNSAARAASAA